LHNPSSTGATSITLIETTPKMDLVPFKAPSPVPRVFPRVLRLCTELGDPAPPWVTVTGAVRILGTAAKMLEFDCWADFLNGRAARRFPLTLLHPDGSPVAEGLATAPFAHGGLLYAGVTAGEERVRRLYAFRETARDVWLREPLPLFADRTDRGWIDHGAHPHLVTDDDGQAWVFYERVIAETRGTGGAMVPCQIGLFARRLISPSRAAREELAIFNVGRPPYPATRLGDGGFSAFGPRPVKAVLAGETFYLLGFGAAFGSLLHFAWSRHLTGPYLPLLQASAHGLDLLDVGAALRQRYGLTHGPSRPAAFQDPAGHWWVLFHADRPRATYLVPMRLGLDDAGLPELTLLDA
jgi:hypothetical protein